ncbi:uncharacterized protein LOC143284106 [Babylonia areolata]|uniref:uncharacterized protein LOC143284106 n=1 Tax=Babylonia areolata TaxID=304850 RepID=UPI003FD54433
MKASTVLLCGLLLVACVASSSALRIIRNRWFRGWRRVPRPLPGHPYPYPYPGRPRRGVGAAGQAASADEDDAGEAGDTWLEAVVEKVNEDLKKTLEAVKEAVVEKVNEDLKKTLEAVKGAKAKDPASGWKLRLNGLQWQSKNGHSKFKLSPTLNRGKPGVQFYFKHIF